MQPIAMRKTTKDLVYEQLKRGIFNGTISREEILTETKLAETLNTSRTPIREAVADLTNEGLFVHIPRKGFQVRSIEEHELEQIFFLRASIEMKGISLLAETINNSQVDKLKNIISKQEIAIRENDRIAYIEFDQIFHRKILQFANQNILEGIFGEIYNLSQLIGHAAITNEGRMEEVIKEHMQIVEALENKKADEAIEFIKKHLEVTGISAKKRFYNQNVNDFREGLK